MACVIESIPRCLYPHRGWCLLWWFGPQGLVTGGGATPGPPWPVGRGCSAAAFGGNVAVVVVVIVVDVVTVEVIDVVTVVVFEEVTEVIRSNCSNSSLCFCYSRGRM